MQFARATAQAKEQVFGHYGWECACCDAVENLTIDHVNGGGEEHRKELGLSGGGLQFYLWLIKNDFPDGFQVLCMRCNARKGGGEWCRLDHALGIVTDLGAMVL